MNPWDDLPNAKYIDRIISSVKTNTQYWTKTGDRPYIECWDSVVSVATSVDRMKFVFDTWEIMWNIMGERFSDVSYEFSRGVVLALITYDDCAYMIDSEPGELAILARLGDARAILLLPACKVFNKK